MTGEYSIDNDVDLVSTIMEQYVTRRSLLACLPDQDSVQMHILVRLFQRTVLEQFDEENPKINPITKQKALMVVTARIQQKIRECFNI